MSYNLENGHSLDEFSKEGIDFIKNELQLDDLNSLTESELDIALSKFNEMSLDDFILYNEISFSDFADEILLDYFEEIVENDFTLDSLDGLIDIQDVNGNLFLYDEDEDEYEQNSSPITLGLLYPYALPSEILSYIYPDLSYALDSLSSYDKERFLENYLNDNAISYLFLENSRIVWMK